MENEKICINGKPVSNARICINDQIFYTNSEGNIKHRDDDELFDDYEDMICLLNVKFSDHRRRLQEEAKKKEASELKICENLAKELKFILDTHGKATIQLFDENNNIVPIKYNGFTHERLIIANASVMEEKMKAFKEATEKRLQETYGNKN